ncbi:Retrovirus-related Pol polyprotein [Labeo rohita]|uniref:ribonuclease H n=1 Tax=Labeo rohita TaxID=84645 RepID=A0ABQ8L7H4_LABRO|nr:Retrovirus-related Pol polyprotein [Labeo rohita]
MSIPSLTKKPIQKSFLLAKSVTGDYLDTLGMLPVTIRLGEEVFSHDVQERVPLRSNAVTLEPFLIPARSQMNILAKIQANIGEKEFTCNYVGLLDPEIYSIPGLFVARTVTSVKAGVTCVRAMNPTNEDCHVPCGTRLGEFHSLVTQPGEEFTIQEPTVAQIQTQMDPCPKSKVDLSQSALDSEEQAQLETLISKYSDVFSVDDCDYGRTDLVKHTIRTGDAQPIRQRAYRTSPHIRAEIDRKLNAVTVKDSYPLPRASDALDSLAGARWFSTMDLSSGYWQVELDPKDREKTAFNTGSALYQFKVMPMGLTNAPPTFQRLMELVLLKSPTWVMLYPARVCSQMKRTWTRSGLDLPPGLSPRRFVRNFAVVAAPLHALTQKGAVFNWSSECEKAFQSLKQALTSPPVVAHPIFTLPFLLYTDASHDCVGSVLAQMQDGKECVIAYASHALTPSEKKWSTYDRELWAVVWSVRHFRHFLSGAPFKIITDHKPLLNLKKVAVDNDPTSRRARWILEMDLYDFTILHREGKQHSNADSLSRRPSLPVTETKAVQCVISSHTTAKRVPFSSEVPLVCGVLSDITPTLSVDKAELQAQQKADFCLSTVMAWKESNQRPPLGRLKPSHATLRKLWHEFPKLSVQEGVLCRRVKSSPHSPPGYQVVLPEQENYAIGLTCPVIFRSSVLNVCPVSPVPPPLLMKGPLYSRFMQKDHSKELLLTLLSYLLLYLGIVRVRQFESDLIKHLCSQLGIEKTRTSPYHAQCDGMVERLNRTLKDQLAKYICKSGGDWDRYLPQVELAYNSSVHCSTGFSPFFLAHGREPRLPAEILLNCSPAVTSCTPGTPADYARDVTTRLSYAFKDAAVRSTAAKLNQKRQYDKKTFFHPHKPGDRRPRTALPSAAAPQLTRSGRIVKKPERQGVLGKKKEKLKRVGCEFGCSCCNADASD